MELKIIVQWFIAVKMPDKKEAIESDFNAIERQEPLPDIAKKLFGFMLFSYAMNTGPSSFLSVEKIAEEIDVISEFKYYAKSWIDYSSPTKHNVK
jgi:hypothetical protein